MYFFSRKLLRIVGVLVGAIAVEAIGATAAWWLQRPDVLWMTSAGVLLVAMPALSIGRRMYEKRLKDGFSLFVTAEEMEPRHMGFEQLLPGAEVPSSCRPYFAGTYISRTAVAYDERNRSPSVVYDEAAMVQVLGKGENLLLVGPVLEGKSRTLLEVVRRMRGFILVRPRDDRAPTDDELELLRGKDVVCLLDDLLAFAGAAIDLLHFYRSVHARARICSVAATYPHDPALEEAEIVKQPALRIFQVLTLRLALLPASAKDKRSLQQLLGLAEEGDFATLGLICMRAPIDRIRAHFHRLDSVAMSCVEAMQLLIAGGVYPIFRRRLQCVLSNKFLLELEGAELRDCLKRLEGWGFVISPADADPVVPQPVYLASPSAGYYYSSRHSCSGDLQRLEQSLLAIRDAKALNLLALTYRRDKDFDSALRCWATVIDRFAADGDALQAEQVQRARTDLAMTRWLVGDIEGVISDYTSVIESPRVLEEQIAWAYLNRGMEWETRGDQALHDTDPLSATYFSKAISDYAAAANLVGAPSELIARAFNNRGAAWEKLGRFDLEQEDYGRVIAMPDAPLKEKMRAHVNRAATILMHGPVASSKLQTAVQDCSAVIEFSRTNSPADGLPFAYRAIARARLGDSVAAGADALIAEKLGTSTELLQFMRTALVGCHR